MLACAESLISQISTRNEIFREIILTFNRMGSIREKNAKKSRDTATLSARFPRNKFYIL